MYVAKTRIVTALLLIKARFQLNWSIAMDGKAP